ncbi:hypothetical protein [Sorangium sp. So ce128]|uniref:hypothetical protein n=1 Tax=Sorangium sp. So ce128 TaxID=3133281 RepID=UPI003F5EAA7D
MQNCIYDGWEVVTSVQQPLCQVEARRSAGEDPWRSGRLLLHQQSISSWCCWGSSGVAADCPATFLGAAGSSARRRGADRALARLTRRLTGEELLHR